MNSTSGIETMVSSKITARLRGVSRLFLFLMTMIKESIERLVFPLHNFVVFKIDGLGGGVEGGLGMQ